MEIYDVLLTELVSSPLNPRKEKDGPGFAELVESIKQKGVLEPIIVRKTRTAAGKAKYEIVAGERRFLASKAAGLGVIPVIVKELTDDEAYDVMLIENMQRKDLTPREEAESFKSYISKHGKDALAELSQRIGVDVRYVRRHVQALELPKKVLDMWAKGFVVFGHLEQLLRLKDAAQVNRGVRELGDSARRRGGRSMPVEELREWIDSQSVNLKCAFFAVKDVCATCSANSAVQNALFAIDDGKKVFCADPVCFKKKQNEYLSKHWKETVLYAKYKTSGFRFDDSLRYNDYSSFAYSLLRPGQKCQECVNFVTMLRLDGEVREKQICLDRKCFASQESAARAKSAGESKTKRVKADGPRVPWHGEYFRDLFYKRRIPEILAGLEPKSKEVTRALLFAVCRADTAAEQGVAKKLGMATEDGGIRLDGKGRGVLDKLAGMPWEKLIELFIPAVQAAVLAGPSRMGWHGFGTEKRRLVAAFLGVDTAKEFAVDEEYLQKKTRAEILAFGNKFKLFDKNVDAPKLKKGELVKVVLAHGKKLVGLVPAEILK